MNNHNIEPIIDLQPETARGIQGLLQADETLRQGVAVGVLIGDVLATLSGEHVTNETLNDKNMAILVLNSDGHTESTGTYSADDALPYKIIESSLPTAEPGLHIPDMYTRYDIFKAEIAHRIVATYFLDDTHRGSNELEECIANEYRDNWVQNRDAMLIDGPWKDEITLAQDNSERVSLLNSPNVWRDDMKYLDLSSQEGQEYLDDLQYGNEEARAAYEQRKSILRSDELESAGHEDDLLSLRELAASKIAAWYKKHTTNEMPLTAYKEITDQFEFLIHKAENQICFEIEWHEALQPYQDYLELIFQVAIQSDREESLSEIRELREGLPIFDSEPRINHDSYMRVARSIAMRELVREYVYDLERY